MRQIDYVEIIEKIDNLQERVQMLETENIKMKKRYQEETTLTKPSDVQKYLNISKNGLNSLVSNKRLIEGIHYNTTKSGRRIYITEAIIEFEKTYIKYEKPTNKTDTENAEILKRLIS